MTWFSTSDLHFGHARIIELAGRPFSSVEEMNEALIDNWNSKVGPRDLTFIHGDVCMGKRDESVPLIGRLNGRKVLITGNHDNCWKYGKNPEKWLPLYAPYFERISTYEAITLPNGVVADAHHFPFTGDNHDEDRYTQYRLKDEGQWLLHGHTHAKEKTSGPRSIHVGVDAWDFTPVAHEEIVGLMESMQEA